MQGINPEGLTRQHLEKTIDRIAELANRSWTFALVL